MIIGEVPDNDLMFRWDQVEVVFGVGKQGPVPSGWVQLPLPIIGLGFVSDFERSLVFSADFLT